MRPKARTSSSHDNLHLSILIFPAAYYVPEFLAAVLGRKRLNWAIYSTS